MTKRQKNHLLKLAVALIIFVLGGLSNQLPAFQNNPDLNPGFYRVTQFDDGDTLIVDMNGRDEKIRFIGVDTPETHDPRKPVQCFGRAASAFTAGLIGDKPVRLEADPTNTNRDRYNRLLRYAYLQDGTLVNAEIIKQGYGFAYLSFPVQKAEQFRRLEKEARDNNRGLWGKCEVIKNNYGGYSSPAEN